APPTALRAGADPQVTVEVDRQIRKTRTSLAAGCHDCGRGYTIDQGREPMRSRTSSMRLTGISNLAVTAPIKAGFIDGFETITYLDRLNRLLTALNASRTAIRESSLLPPPFPDSIGRFDIIRSFRYAVIPPEGEGPRDPINSLAPPGTSRLSLNVTFDAGWEPYMRVIYRDIGTLLDAL